MKVYDVRRTDGQQTPSDGKAHLAFGQGRRTSSDGNTSHGPLGQVSQKIHRKVHNQYVSQLII